MAVNISRGRVVDEPALVDALKNGPMAGAALDVFEQEPLPQDHPLWTTPNTIITPHMAASDSSYINQITEIFAQNINRVDNGEQLINEVDRYRGY